MSWSTFIDRALASDHGVQVYAELDELAASVGTFLGAGFSAGAPAVVIASPGHRARFEDELRARECHPEVLRAEGLLTCKDAGELLAAIMDGELPSPTRFEQVVGGLLDEVAGPFPGSSTRAFGEMVDLLWRRGQEDAAVALEELWNELAESRSFALLCGYHLDIFDIDVQAAALPRIFGAHSHVRPAAEPSRLAAAVDRALAEVAGPVEAARIYIEVAGHERTRSVPRAQAVLAWLSSDESSLGARVLDRARAHYAQLRAAPTGHVLPA